MNHTTERVKLNLNWQCCGQMGDSWCLYFQCLVMCGCTIAWRGAFISIKSVVMLKIMTMVLFKAIVKINHTSLITEKSVSLISSILWVTHSLSRKLDTILKPFNTFQWIIWRHQSEINTLNYTSQTYSAMRGMWWQLP